MPWDFFGKARLRALESSRDELERTNRSLSSKVSHLEGLLDSLGGPDLDAKLPGDQAQGLFRSLTASQASRDLPESKRLDVLRMSHAAYALRGDAHDIIETFVDFIVGEGAIGPKAVDKKDTATQDVLTELWDDDHNRLGDRIEEWVRSTLLEGERFVTADLNPLDGSLTYGWLAPELVEGVIRDTTGKDVWLKVRNDQRPTRLDTWFVLDALDERIQIGRLPEPGPDGELYSITETRVSGDTGAGDATMRYAHGLAFAWFINRPGGATRGRPELAETLDYIDIHDELIWTTLEREKLLKAFILDIESQDIRSKADADAKIKELGLHKPPSGPKVLAHNDRLKVNVFQPDFSTASFADLERILAVNIYGAKGFPEHWRGSGADSNLATAQAQDAKPMRRMRRKQQVLVDALTRLISVSLTLRERAGSMPPIDHEKWKVEAPEIGGKDAQRGAAVLRDITTALVSASTSGLIEKDAANFALIETLRAWGFDIPDEMAGVPEYDADQILALADRLNKASQVDEARGGQDGGTAKDSKNPRDAKDEKSAKREAARA